MKVPTFTENESKILKDALADDGFSLFIPNAKEKPVEVHKADGNGGFKKFKTLNKGISDKLHQIYSEPNPSGYDMIGLNWFVQKYLTKAN